MWHWGGKKREETLLQPGPEPTVRAALLSERPSDILLRWARTGHLREVLPDVEALRGVSQAPAHKDDAFIHTLKAVDAIAPTPVRRWAALLHDIGKGPTYLETPDGRSRFFEHDKFGAEMVAEIMSSAGEDEQLIRDVRHLVSLHMRPISFGPDWTDSAVRRLVEDAEEGRGPEGWADLVALARADLHGYLPEPIQRGLWVLDSLEERYTRILEEERAAIFELESAPRSPLNGEQLIRLAGREAGPWVGELKDFLCREVERGHLDRNDVESASLLAHRWLATRFGS